MFRHFEFRARETGACPTNRRPPRPRLALRANSQRRTPRELPSGRSRPPGAAPPGGSARER